jgi:DNA-binding MarR family transcriptional regulator
MVDESAANPARRAELNRALEELHFAFRAVVARPDEVLARRGLTRVHHRILYFIAKTPDVRVSALRVTLNVTKQAMSAPLRALIERGLVVQVVGDADRRTKHLRLTATGRALEETLSGEQRERFARVFRKAGKTKELAWREVMRLLAADSP